MKFCGSGTKNNFKISTATLQNTEFKNILTLLNFSKRESEKQKIINVTIYTRNVVLELSIFKDQF